MTSSPSKSPSGGMGSPRGVSKTTVLAVSVVAIVSVVYAGCSQQPNIHIIIFIPHSINLRKYTYNLNVLPISKEKLLIIGFHLVTIVVGNVGIIPAQVLILIFLK